MALRPYQHTFKQDIYALLKKGHKKVLGVAPTGSGKTAVACAIMADIVMKNKRVWFLVDRDDLVRQTAAAIKKNGLDCGYIKAGYEENPDSAIQVCSVQTLIKRDWWKKASVDVIILDEAHELSYAEVVKEQLMRQFFPDAVYIALTATPYRLSSRENLGDIYTAMAQAPVPALLMQMGFLSVGSYYGIGQPNLDGVKTYGGDYQTKDLAQRCDTPETVKSAVAEWHKRTPGTRTLVFCINQHHAAQVAQAFRDTGVPAVAIIDSTPIKTRRQYYKAIEDKKLLVIAAVDIANKGLDLPCLETGMLLRPTMSRAIHEQQIGRLMRLSPETGKSGFVVLDSSGNIKKFGFVEDKQKYYLTHTGEKNPEDNPTPLKECPPGEPDKKGMNGCGALLYGFQMECPHCGYEFTAKDKDAVVLPLIKLHVNENQRQEYLNYQRFLREAYQNKHSPGYALVRFQGGNDKKFPPKDWGRNAVFHDEATPEDVYEYFDHLHALSKKLNKQPAWISKYMSIEFGEGNWKSIVDANRRADPVAV